ncbi:hypothetical protein N665_2696s0001 [Sinapis alba]|nr:hypothetical protein N665_2696s0001 [Sinapis alba]
MGEWAQMELRHMNFRSDTAGPSVEFRQRATNTDMEDSVPVRIGMGGKERSGRRKMKSVLNKPASISNKHTPDDQERLRDLPEHFVDICKDWRNTPFIIRPAAYQGLLAAWDGPQDQCPWTGKVDKDLGCTHEHVEEESVYRVNDLVYLDKIVEKDLILILQKQPILVVMKYCDELEGLREGIYDGPSASKNKSSKKRWRSGLHVVEVLGYNTDTAGKQYWLVQMASGAEWGVNGVGKVMRQIIRKEDKSLFVSALYPKVGLREA